MSNRAIPLEQFQINTPCIEDWSAMHGDAAKRFCDKCNKHVHDLSHFDRAEADALLSVPVAGHVCVRMARDEAGRVITRDYWKFAAGVALVAGVGLSGCETRTQGEPAHQPLPAGQVLGGKPMAQPLPTGQVTEGKAKPPVPQRELMGDVCVEPPKPVQAPPSPMTVQGGICPPLTGSPVPVPVPPPAPPPKAPEPKP